MPLVAMPGGEEDGVLLGDADVEELAGQLGRELREAGAARHRPGDADDAGVGLREPDHRLAEDVLVGGGGARLRLHGVARHRVEAAHAVELLGGIERRLEALALRRHDVDQDGDVALLGELEVLLELLQVVAVDRADVAQPELLERGSS
jgi:hypothetical protein